MRRALPCIILAGLVVFSWQKYHERRRLALAQALDLTLVSAPPCVDIQ